MSRLRSCEFILDYRFLIKEKELKKKFFLIISWSLLPEKIRLNYFWMFAQLWNQIIVFVIDKTITHTEKTPWSNRIHTGQMQLNIDYIRRVLLSGFACFTTSFLKLVDCNLIGDTPVQPIFNIHRYYIYNTRCIKIFKNKFDRDCKIHCTR